MAKPRLATLARIIPVARICIYTCPCNGTLLIRHIVFMYHSIRIILRGIAFNALLKCRARLTSGRFDIGLKGGFVLNT